MAYYRVTKKQSGGGGSDVVFKNYIKFNGKGIILPWTIDGTHTIEVTFYETTYYNQAAIIGNDRNNDEWSHLTTYSSKYYCSRAGGAQASFGSWSAGEHTFVENDSTGHNTFDGVEVTTYSPATNSYFRTLGCRGSITTNAYYGYIKEYKIYSLTNNALLHDLKAALIYNQTLGVNQACFIDVVDGAIYCNETLQAVDTIS